MASIGSERIIALDLRAKRFSYAVFESPGTILDWGTRAHSDGQLERRVDKLLISYLPSLILVRNTAARHKSRHRPSRPGVFALEGFAKRLTVPVRVIEDSTRLRFFAENTRINKYDIAQRVVNAFPELSWRLPPKRKPWQTEPARQSVFDAASLGVIFFEQQKQKNALNVE